MPSHTRGKIKQHCSSACHNLTTAQECLVKAGHYYEKDHQDTFQRYCQAIALIEEMKTHIDRLRAEI